MTVFRWIVGGIAVLMAVAALASIAINLAFDSPLWLDRARRFRHWLWLVCLLWFNLEVWGRVAYTLVHWTR